MLWCSLQMRRKDFTTYTTQLVEKRCVDRGSFVASNTMVRNSHGTSAVKQDNITWFLINKIKLMPQGNFAKCTIYLSAAFRLSFGVQKLPVSAKNKKAISKLKIILFLNQKWHHQIERIWGKRFTSKWIIFCEFVWTIFTSLDSKMKQALWKSFWLPLILLENHTLNYHPAGSNTEIREEE